MAYSGRYNPKNPEKYNGNPTNIVFRSLWERQVFRFCDENPDIKFWSSEEIIVPYVCKTDKRPHRYFVDLKLTFKDERVFLIEIKPKKETIQPKVPSRKSPRYIREVLTYVKNQSKWEAANEYALDRGWIFQVWTEDTLKALGIRLIQ